jgi:hypothetical protein
MKRALIALTLLFAAAPPTLAQERIELPKEAYTQAASGMTFPVRVGAFRRLDTVTRYAPDGSDESVGYNWEADEGRVSATIYIYPSPSLANASASNGNVDVARVELCAAQFSSVTREVATVHPHAQVEANDIATLRQRNITYAGRELIFTVTSPSAFGKNHAPFRSEAYLFCYVGGRWSVKYRFTYPAAIDAADEITDFMRDLIWTIEPEQL